MEGSYSQQQQVSSPAEPEPCGSVYQSQVPVPPSGVIYDGDLAIFQAKISGQEVWVVNNNETPVEMEPSPSTIGISVEEYNDLSDLEEDGGSPESRLWKFLNQVEGEDDENNKGKGQNFVNQVEVEEKTKKSAAVKTKKRSVKKVKKEKKKGGDERQFACEHCDYKATQKISLLRHLEVHAGKKFACEEADCGKSYRWETDLRRHQVSAHSNLTFPCPEPDCDYVGRSGRNLATHQRSKHSGDRPDLVCQICGEKFCSSSYLEVHVKSKHLGVREPCSECGENFATKANLQRHLKEKHQGGDIKCEFCDKTFTRKLSKESHVKKVHQERVEN